MRVWLCERALTRIVSTSTEHEFLQVVGEQRKCSTCVLVATK